MHYDFDFLAAEKECQRAIELNPRYATAHQWYGHCLAYMGRLEHCLRALELDPSFETLRWVLAHVYQGKGMYEQAICERKRAVELSSGAPLYIAELGASYAAAGQRDKALQILEQLHELSKHHYVMAYCMALIYSGMKEKEKAFHWLEKAHQERAPMFVFVKVDPRLDYLRSDPRFDAFLRRMNFPP
jgi:tetratricopeptide (TPR) repeat protein